MLFKDEKGSSMLSCKPIWKNDLIRLDRPYVERVFFSSKDTSLCRKLIFKCAESRQIPETDSKPYFLC